MKIALAQLNYHIGNFDSNAAKIIAYINLAKTKGADLVVFSELAICGYPPLDFLDFGHFVQQCKGAMEKIAFHCQGITALVGGPSVNPVPEGKNLFNSAWVLTNGTVDKIIHKTLLPTYDVFDEYRYFESNKTFETIIVKGVNIAVTICEDLWNIEEDPLYTFCPLDKLILQKPAFIINLAASPFSFNHEEARKKMLQKNALRYNLPIYYVNQVGAQTELVFDGGSLVMDRSGLVVAEMKYFKEDFQIFDSDQTYEVSPSPKSEIEKTHAAIILGIRDYFEKMNFKQAILGLSGGIDSAVVLALAAEALGHKNVLSVLMPSDFSSENSITDSIRMCGNLDSPFMKIPVNSLYDQFLKALHEPFKNLAFGVTEENLQARIRGTLLMALSNKFGYILLNTSNKSELAVGYGTLYGDMCGGLSVIGDLYKTKVYALARHLNRNQEVIPLNIITKPPSAELRPGQKDSDSLPEYELLDRMLFLYIEKCKSPEEIIASGFDKDLVFKVLKMVNSNEYKRKQFAPVLRVSPKAFGMGRRMPLVGKYLS